MMKTIRLFVALASLISGYHVSAATAVFAGGCFWCVEADFEKLDGVSEGISGFTGGTMKNPTYGGDHHGHYEAVEIHYDPAVVSYKELLHYYWRHIDPFDDKGQFCDKGHAYRSAVFVANKEQRKLAEESKREVEKLFPGQAVATQILDAGTFYPIKGNEIYHQDYYKKYPYQYKFYRWGCGRDRRVEEIWGERDNN